MNTSCLLWTGRLLIAATTLFCSPGRAADWPQWRGPARDGHLPAGTPAVNALPKELKVVWRKNIGGGFSSPIVVGGKVIYLDEQDKKETVHVLDAITGNELWHAPFAETYGDEWGSGPRSTPFVEGDRLYVQACNGEFRCLNLADGQERWRTSFEKDFGVAFRGSKANEGTASRRGNNGSGVIDGDRVVLPVGGPEGASLVCFDKLTGKVFWKTGSDEAAYSSLMAGTLAGVRQIVAFTADALMGVARTDGKILWRVPLKTNAKRHAASPVIFGDHVVVNSHTIGMVCFKIIKDSAGLKAEEAWANKDLKINLATPVLVGGNLFCQGADKDYICVDAQTGGLKWSQAGFGQGKKDYSSTIAAGKNLLVLSEDGQLFLLAADGAKYIELGRQQVCGNTWSFPACANGRLYVRDGRSLTCLELRADQ